MLIDGTGETSICGEVEGDGVGDAEGSMEVTHRRCS